MFEPSPTEREILHDIETKSGLNFDLIDSVPTRDPAVANAALPVLAAWVSRVPDSTHRHMIYRRFYTPYAHPYLEDILSWFSSEQDEELRGTLGQVLAQLATESNAKRLWQMLRCDATRLPDYLLLAKLATVPSSIQGEARNCLIEDLRSNRLRTGDLKYAAQVDAPQIREWSALQANSPDRTIRALAKRVAQRRRKLPKGLVSAHTPPDRRRECFSAELDSTQLRGLLRQLSREIGLKIPRGISNADFLSALPVDQWAIVSEAKVNGRPANLWLRMEDVDTVEIVVTTDSPSRVQ
jgi:hypothetical protein